uniref:Uncharacterized protein n=1 Tax=Lutzomyia longipalpis TaxID=7200 RepID=A0A1B0CTW5_LUTLO
MRSSNECEKSSLKLLREEYKKFMDEDRQRVERNENLLQTLDRIDFQAAALAAKTERLKLLKTQYKSLLMKNWAGDGGSRIVSHRSNISSPQEYHGIRYARTSPIYQNHGPNYWSDGEMGGSMKNAPQIRDMEIQTSLTMLDVPHSVVTSFSTLASARATRDPLSPQENHQDAKCAGSLANQMESPECGAKEIPPSVSPEWNKMLPNPVVTSTITTSQSDYHASSPSKWEEIHEVEMKETKENEELGASENTSKLSFAQPEDPPCEPSFYLREMPEVVAHAPTAEAEEVDDGKIEEHNTPEYNETAEEVVQEEKIDSGQNEMGEQLGNLSTAATPKPRTSFLRHALLKNTKHELIGRGRSGGDKGTQKVVKRVEFCLDQNESHEDTKSQWNLDEIGETTSSPYYKANAEETQVEPLAEERSLMSPHYSQYVEPYEPTQGEELNQFDDEYERDELESETQEEPSYADTQNIHEEPIETGDIPQHQVEYTPAVEESTINLQSSNYQYPETGEVVEPYYAGNEDNVQTVVDENVYASEAPFAVHSSYVQDNSELPQSEVSSTPSVHLLTQDPTTAVVQPESPYQQFISPDANVQQDTYHNSGFTASSEYLEAPQQQTPQDFGANEVYTGSEYQQYDGSAINQVGEYDGYDTTSAPSQPEDYNLNQGVMGYEQNYANYGSQDVQYASGGTIEGYEQGYSDANYAEGAGSYIGTDEVREYEQGPDGVYMSGGEVAPSDQVEASQAMYANFQQEDQYSNQQEVQGDYYNLTEEPTVASNVLDPNATLQTLPVENANQDAPSPQTTYSDDSSNYITQEPPIAEQTLQTEKPKTTKSTNFLDSSSSESERRPGQKVKFADEEKHFPANDESDFDFSSQRDDK